MTNIKFVVKVNRGGTRAAQYVQRSYFKSNTNNSDEIHTRPSRANSSSCLRTVRATGHELGDWLQAESEVTQQKAKTVIAQNLILKERKRPGSTESRGASFEQPASGPLG